jgi:hypothetical protein
LDTVKSEVKSEGKVVSGAAARMPHSHPHNLLMHPKCNDTLEMEKALAFGNKL